MDSVLVRALLLAGFVASALWGNRLMRRPNAHRRGIDRTPWGTDVMVPDLFTEAGDAFRRRAARLYLLALALLATLVWLSL